MIRCAPLVGLLIRASYERWHKLRWVFGGEIMFMKSRGTHMMLSIMFARCRARSVLGDHFGDDKQCKRRCRVWKFTFATVGLRQ